MNSYTRRRWGVVRFPYSLLLLLLAEPNATMNKKKRKKKSHHALSHSHSLRTSSYTLCLLLASTEQKGKKREKEKEKKKEKVDSRDRRKLKRTQFQTKTRRAAMGFVCTPPPPDHHPVSKRIGIDALILTSTIVIVLITFLSTVARRSGNKFLRIFLTVLSQLYIPLITYTTSATGNIKTPSPLLIVSATLLQLIFEQTIPTRRIEINASKSSIDEIEQLTDLGWLGFLILDNDTVPKEFKIPAILILILSIVKVVKGQIASRLANRSFSVGQNAKLIACYMEQLKSETEPQWTPESLMTQREFMSEYRYLVMGEEKQQRMLSPTGYNIMMKDTDDFVTVDKIWACQGPLLHDNESNRDICLSFALCKLLKRRFERLPLAESNSRKSMNLILHGPFSNHQRAFRIIETELAFLDDYFYSPYPYTYYGWFLILNIFLALLFLASNFYLGVHIVQALIDHTSSLHQSYQSFAEDQKLKHQYVNALLYLDAVVCLIILIVTGCTEAWEVITYRFSNHAKIVLLCKYVKNYSKPWARKTIELLYTHHQIFKLWPNKLGQYSICKKKMEQSVRVPDEVKRAIVRSLRNSEDNISDGSALLIQSNASIPMALEACRLESHAERILVWHIATSTCEDRESAFGSVKRNAASSLSRYCAYLVVSVPELIPDYRAWTRFISNGVIAELHPKIRKGYWLSKLLCMRKLVGFEQGPPERPGEVVKMGRELGERLIQGISDEARRWEVLADLWAEMMLYLSVWSNDLDAHVDNMEKGGEFITHVWALLSHIGINRCCD